jgi:hypothetical protein
MWLLFLLLTGYVLWPVLIQNQHETMNPYRQLVGLLGKETSPSQGRYLKGQQKHRKSVDILVHPCLEWNSNVRSQCSCLRSQGHCDRQINTPCCLSKHRHNFTFTSMCSWYAWSCVYTIVMLSNTPDYKHIILTGLSWLQNSLPVPLKPITFNGGKFSPTVIHISVVSELNNDRGW